MSAVNARCRTPSAAASRRAASRARLASEPTTIYMDGFTGALFLDKPGEIDKYGRAFEDLWTNASSEPESRSVIADAARELRE
jgi:hypothetical protein